MVLILRIGLDNIYGTDQRRDLLIKKKNKEFQVYWSRMTDPI